MKIAVIGTRGIPGIQGGVETHCENLYPRLAKLGCDITIFRRKGYTNKQYTEKEFKGVKLQDTFAPKITCLEAIIHSFFGVIYAKKNHAQILHIHAIGPSLVAPVARLLGLKVIVTNHGPDYDRQKWNNIAKSMLKYGEKMAAHYAQKIIIISEVIKDLMIEKYHCNSKLELIFNGVNLPSKSINTEYIESLGLESQKYIIAVGRFVEEKGFHDLIDAYKNIITDYKLVLVGDADIPSAYSENLKAKAKDAGVVLTGFIKGEALQQIFSHARLFVLPSYHEGLPIALLEAMSYNLNVLVSNIPANIKVNLAKENYFKVGDIYSLSLKLKKKLLDYKPESYRETIEQNFNWDTIAKQTYSVYASVCQEIPTKKIDKKELQKNLKPRQLEKHSIITKSQPKPSHHLVD